MGNVKLQMSHTQGKAIEVRGEASGCPIAQAYELLVTEFGQCSKDTGRDEKNIEFNPLEEKDIKGNVVLFQDLTRGRLESFVTDATGAANVKIGNWPIQDNFLQNLSGRESLIGRAVYLVQVDTDKTGAVTKKETSCCVIGRDMVPVGHVEPIQENKSCRASKKFGTKDEKRFARQPIW